MTRQTPFWFGVLVVAILGCGNNASTTPQTGPGHPTTKTPSTATGGAEKGPTITAKQLSEEFVKDEATAEKKYEKMRNEKKPIEVEGVIKDLHKSPPLVYLEGVGDATVGFSFYPADSPAGKLVQTLTTGQKVKISGDFSISRNNGKLVEMRGKTMEVVE